MKIFLHLIALTLGMLGSGWAQNYQPQPQYPVDPYNPSPQPQPQGYSTTGTTYGSYGAPASSYEQLLTYGSLDVNYVYNDFRGDDRLEGESGFAVDLKVELMKPLFLHFGFDRISSSASDSNDELSISSFSAAGGVFLPIGSRVHIVGEVGARYDYVSGDLDYISTDDFSLFIKPSIRFAATDKLELSAGVLFSNTENFNERVLEFNAYYAMLSWLDVGLGLDIGDDINSYRLGGRWRW